MKKIKWLDSIIQPSTNRDRILPEKGNTTFPNIQYKSPFYSESFRVSILTSEKKESSAGVGCGPPRKFVVKNLEEPVEAKESCRVFGVSRRRLVQTKAKKEGKSVSFKVKKNICIVICEAR